MDALRAHLQSLVRDKAVEPNSSLGAATRYFLERWAPLTAFLRVPGARLDPLDNTLERPIRSRNASLFYRTLVGARAGDIYMALIVTTELHGGDPFAYLTALLTHEEQVAANRDHQLPWNYPAALARVELARHPAALDRPPSREPSRGAGARVGR